MEQRWERMHKKIHSVMILTLLLMGMLTLTFNIQPVRAIGTIYIRADGSIDPSTAPILRDGDLYTLTDDVLSDMDGIVIERNNMTLDGADHALQGSEAWYSRGVSLIGRSNVTIKNLIIKDFTAGIDVETASNNSFYENNVIDNWYGITLEHSSNNNSIYRNNVTNNKWWGINLYESSNNNSILRNNVTDNLEDGISLDMSSSNNSIYGNNVVSNRYGIRLWYSPNNSISENNIASSHYGIYVRQSSENIFYHNNFVNNLHQVYIYASEPGETPPINAWDDGYPSGGNYWNDYAGSDANGDGLGDTPYTIDASNQDRYPLMNPWIERKVGVKVGDWARYNVDASWTGILDPHFKMWSETEWGMIEVTEVQGTIVTFTGTSHFKNGSELTVPGAKWDIAPTGSYGIILYFVASNLQEGDRIFSSGISTINETVTRTYCGIPRENNHYNSSSRGLPPGYDLYKLDCHWDKSTGILTEEHLDMSTDDLSRSLSLHFKMVDTNLWQAPVQTTIDELKTDIEDLGFEGEIDNQGIVTSLLAKLNAAQKLVEDEKIDQAKNILHAFINEVKAQSGKHTTPEATDILIESAEYILSHL